ncbi:MAG: hypothetical protein JO236_11550 [Mycobacterium sp.]|uniref:hypothetical protein n=1 Tax=Mycobacterium sp. TaxID=1785 RepID=UPI001EC0C55C|nr:hypothetical protein [Mycobacterium sp.]MBW0018163.1 hypothetical protein [Mycobacterium sp.]
MTQSTGDFDLVLEVSAETLNRLVATMHQNGFPHPSLPSLPHVLHLRLPGKTEHGSVDAQTGCPSVTLIDGATDRFTVDIGLRAEFHRDPGSAPLADIIYGNVRAIYRIQDIDPECPGWHDIAEDFLWLRVIGSSVSFDGLAYDQSPSYQLIPPADQDALNQKVTKYLATLLTFSYAPVPQRIDRRFRRFRSLVDNQGPRGSALAFPLSMDGEEAAGAIESIQEIFLAGSDFAIAINAGVITEMIASQLADFDGLQRDFHVHGDAGFAGGLEIDYHVQFASPKVEWAGPTPFGVPVGFIRISAEGQGWATRLHRSGVFNIGPVRLADLAMTATVEQYLSLTFTLYDGFIVAAAGPPTATVQYNGPYSSDFIPAARQRITDEMQTLVKANLGAAQSKLSSFNMADKVAALAQTLQSVDPAADAVISAVTFHPDAIVLHGTASFAQRVAASTDFSKNTAGDGFSAINSWIPGGRIDQFIWVWQWYNTVLPAPTDPPGSSTQSQTFELRRPHDSRTRFGRILNVESPLPGLDGLGRMCLTVKGMHVDAVTGMWTTTQGVTECMHFGLAMNTPAAVSLPLRLYHFSTKSVHREIGTLAVGSDRLHAPNLLIGYVGQAEWDPAVATATQEGLHRSTRRGAGLRVLLLFAEHTIRRGDREMHVQLQRFCTEAPAPVTVTEDVADRWSAALGIPAAEPSIGWRLLDAEGVLRWAPEGGFSADELSNILDTRLSSSVTPDPVAIAGAPRLGTRLRPELAIPRCPPIPVARPLRPARILFVDNGDASHRMIAQLARQQDADTDLIAVIVRDALSGDTQAISRKFGGRVPVLADTHGETMARCGIRWLPICVDLSTDGCVTGVISDSELSTAVTGTDAEGPIR